MIADKTSEDIFDETLFWLGGRNSGPKLWLYSPLRRAENLLYLDQNMAPRSSSEAASCIGLELPNRHHTLDQNQILAEQFMRKLERDARSKTVFETTGWNIATFRECGVKADTGCISQQFPIEIREEAL